MKTVYHSCMRLNNKFGPLYTYGVFIILLFNCKPVFSQKFSVQPGVGLGSTLAKNENASKKGRVMINLSGYYNLSKQLSFGIEVATAGSFINSVGGFANQDTFDPATNTITKDGSNMKSNTALAKVKYYFIAKKKGIKPFAELGFGVNTYYEKVFHTSGYEEKKIKRPNLAYQPEIGISIRHFQVSVRYLAGGKTPAFAGVDDNSGANVRYESIRISPLYVNFSWRFDF
jgi:hypothetical protein